MVLSVHHGEVSTLCSVTEFFKKKAPYLSVNVFSMKVLI